MINTAIVAANRIRRCISCNLGLLGTMRLLHLPTVTTETCGRLLDRGQLFHRMSKAEWSIVLPGRNRITATSECCYFEIIRSSRLCFRGTASQSLASPNLSIMFSFCRSFRWSRKLHLHVRNSSIASANGRSLSSLRIDSSLDNWGADATYVGCLTDVVVSVRTVRLR